MKEERFITSVMPTLLLFFVNICSLTRDMSMYYLFSFPVALGKRRINTKKKPLSSESLLNSRPWINKLHTSATISVVKTAKMFSVNFTTLWKQHNKHYHVVQTIRWNLLTFRFVLSFIRPTSLRQPKQTIGNICFSVLFYKRMSIPKRQLTLTDK